jgi:hypothetical protein
LIETKGFNYTLYNKFKESNLKLVGLNFENLNQRTLQDGQILLNALNNEYNSNLSIPNHILEAFMTKTDIEDIKTFVINEGLLSNEDVEELINFADKNQSNNFQVAIDEFEYNIISRNLSVEEFEKFDNIASSLKITNDENPEIFENSSYQDRGILRCLVSYLIWIAALIGFVGGCSTVFLCALALVGLAAASYDVVNDCAGYM